MELQVRIECKTCSGLGVTTNEAWDKFNEEHPDTKIFELRTNWRKEFAGDPDSFEAVLFGNKKEDGYMDEWFNKKGYGNWRDCPEEPTCFDCDGLGNIIRWVPVEDVLSEPANKVIEDVKERLAIAMDTLGRIMLMYDDEEPTGTLQDASEEASATMNYIFHYDEIKKGKENNVK